MPSTVDARAGDVKLVGDIDLDGTRDLVLGGSKNERLNWYHFPDWLRTEIATPLTEFTTDGELGDVDGDGDLDIVVPDGSGTNNLRWFENPTRSPSGGTGNPFVGSQWTLRVVGTIGSWGKDVELADFDQDGRLDIATRSGGASMIFFQVAPGTWQQVFLTVTRLGAEGMASGDLDGDGDVDLIHKGSWQRNPGGAAARTGAAWSEFIIDKSGVVSSTFKAAVADINGDGKQDVLFSSSEATAHVVWYRPVAEHTGNWVYHVIEPSLDKAHTLQAGDVDQDGDMDVLVGQMHTSNLKRLALYLNDGDGTSFYRQIIDQGSGLHNGVLCDVGADGDLDVVGANWTGNPPLRLWQNALPQPTILFDAGALPPGGTSLMRATNCTPGAPVYMVYTARPRLDPYWFAPLAVVLELGLPFHLVGVPAAGPNGVADLEVVIPAGLPQKTYYLQALEYGRVSNLEVVRTNLPGYDDL